MTRGGWRRARIAAFAAYALLIVTLTHWPGLTIEGPVARPDLWIHVGVFGGWTVLFAACGWFGPALSARNVLLSGAASLAYATVDEVTQGLPGINRHVAVDDWLANAAGIILATAGLLALGRFAGVGKAGGA